MIKRKDKVEESEKNTKCKLRSVQREGERERTEKREIDIERREKERETGRDISVER